MKTSMTRLAHLSSSLLLGSAALVGCAEAPVYQGNAALEPVVFYPESNAALSGDLPKAAAKYVRSADELTGYDDDWQVRATYNSSASSHVRLDQVHDGIPVWG